MTELTERKREERIDKIKKNIDDLAKKAEDAIRKREIEKNFFYQLKKKSKKDED